ncbi:heavy metal-binding domain-containing protein [Marivirga arenosa]|uniref:Heavy metal-binding domain-containing protein n=1 Tax=Marivirga arenosa TaxID=3059076 RepID=A0AA51NAL0_9BACT|nr:heavy metal-binding domain-containing protein [Marivirga sp. ABR2-2]WMN07560.1 heavy metal-binding domain-containing protein [Marivirga sp. ABR2-2]
MKMKIQLMLIVGVLFTSCSTVAHLQTDDLKQNYSVTNPDQIEIYSTDKVDENYSVIGEVVSSVDAGRDASISVKYLKKEAAKLGADAIINLRLEIGQGYWTNAIKATGTAVKFNN